ncbi:hypothetical protein LINGRAHAP2_LOCUS9072 [Linum grandiflorum]
MKKSKNKDTKKRKRNTDNQPPPPLELQGDDLISKLPPEIIHNILQRLDSPSEAARTSILSKAWHRQFWQSYPVVEYRDSPSDSHSSSRFRSFVASSSRRMIGYFLHNRTPLSALRISLLDTPARDQFELLIGSAARLAASCGSPLEISIEVDAPYGNVLPQSALQNCSRTKVVILSGCHLGEFANSFWAENCPNLETLSLEDEFLPFRLGRIQLTAVPLPLKNLKLGGGIKLKAAAPNLKSVAFHGQSQVTQQEIDELTSLFPSLESVCFRNSIFEGCKFRLKISSPHSKLRKFSLINCWTELDQVVEIVIDAPKLDTFVYGHSSFSPPISNVELVNVASDFQFEVVAHGRHGTKCYAYGWYVDLRPFLERLRSQLRNNNLVLKLWGMECFSSFEIQSQVPWSRITSRDFVDVDHLELNARFWSDTRYSRSGCLLDGCFSICRPTYMSVVQCGRKTEFVEYICRQLMSIRCFKCHHHANKCWRHCLKDAKIKSDTGEMMQLSRFVVSSIADGKLLASNFVLTWEGVD